MACKYWQTVIKAKACSGGNYPKPLFITTPLCCHSIYRINARMNGCQTFQKKRGFNSWLSHRHSKERYQQSSRQNPFLLLPERGYVLFPPPQKSKRRTNNFVNSCMSNVDISFCLCHPFTGIPG